MYEYQFVQDNLDKAVSKAVEAYRAGDIAGLDKQLRIIAFWEREKGNVMEVQIEK